MRRAELQIGNVRNPALFLIAPEQIEVVFAISGVTLPCPIPLLPSGSRNRRCPPGACGFHPPALQRGWRNCAGSWETLLLGAIRLPGTGFGSAQTPALTALRFESYRQSKYALSSSRFQADLLKKINVT